MKPVVKIAFALLLCCLLPVAGSLLLGGCNSWATYKPNTIQGPSVQYSHVGEGGGGHVIVTVVEDANGNLHVVLPQGGGQ